MKTLEKILFTGKVSSQDILSWIDGDKNCDKLNNEDILRQDFVPLFLNYLNEETSRFLQTSNSQSCSQSSWSVIRTSKYISPLKSHKTKLVKPIPAKSLDFSSISLQDGDSTNSSQHAYSIADGSVNNSSLTDWADDMKLLSPVKEQSGSNSFLPSASTSTPKNSRINLTLNTLSTSSQDQETGSPNDNAPRKQNARKNFRRSCHEFSLKNDEDTPHNSSRYAVDSRFKGGKYKRKSLPIPTKANSSHEMSKFDLNSVDEFPPVAAIATNKEPTKRRIKPTPLTTPQYLAKQDFAPSRNDVFNNASSPFDVVEKVSDKASLDQERTLLRKEKEKVLKAGMDAFKNDPFCGASPIKNTSIPFEEKTEPNIQLVTHQEELGFLASLYSTLIIHDMVPNMTAELYYLFQLISVENGVTCKSEASSYDIFSSFHNCVYFAITSLSRLLDYISILDCVTLKLLSQNVRIECFDGGLKIRLDKLCAESPRPCNETTLSCNSSIGNVSFQSETDNRANFPTTVAFQIFRKQRDLFYEILRRWQEEHSYPSWSFKSSVGRKLDELMSFRSSPANMMHLARLVCTQLIKMCQSTDDSDDTIDCTELSFLSQLRHTDPVKWKSLKARFVTSHKLGGPAPLPTFVGAEEFFRLFIIEAKDHVFYCHLKDILISKITKLTAQCTATTDFNRKDALSMLNTLRISAKFLGLVEFLPYQSTERLPENVLFASVQGRNAGWPVVDLSGFLCEAAKAGCLIMVVPWVVEFLSMADPVVFHTKPFLTLAFQLIYIFKMLSLRCSTNGSSCCGLKANLFESPSPKRRLNVTKLNKFYLKSVLGWLFSQPHFPEGLFYAHVSEADIDHDQYHHVVLLLKRFYFHETCVCLQTKRIVGAGYLESPSKKFASLVLAAHDNSPTKQNGDPFGPGRTTPKLTTVSSTETGVKIYLDCQTLVDHEVLLASCPYLREFSKILRSSWLDASKATHCGSYRKITPLSSANKSLVVSSKSVQTLLVENFFHNQPASVKKCVDFIVERLSSNLVATIRSKVTSTLKQAHFENMKTDVCKQLTLNGDCAESINIEEMCHTACHVIIKQASQQARAHLKQVTMSENIEHFLNVLLPSDITSVGRDLCSKVIKKSIQDRMQTWLNTHLSPGFCVKDLTAQLLKFIKDHQKQSNNDIKADTSVVSGTTKGTPPHLVHENVLTQSVPLPSRLLRKIKKHLLLLYDRPMEATNMSGLDVGKTVDEIGVFATSKLCKPSLLKAFETLSAEWVAAICLASSVTLPKDTLLKLCSLWHGPQPIFTQISNLMLLFAPKMFLVLAHKPAASQTAAWNNLDAIVNLLVIDSKLLEVECVKDACMALMAHSWPSPLMSRLGSFLQHFIQTVTEASDVEQDPFTNGVVDWMAWMVKDLD